MLSILGFLHLLISTATSLVSEVFKVFQDRNCRWNDNYNSHTGENEKYQRRNELDGRLGGQFFGPLPALSPQRVGETSQGFGDGGAEAVGLHQHGYEGPNTLRIGAGRE